jgi:hypothetical protein
MKQKLRDLIKAGRDKERSALVPEVDDAPPEAPGRWTAKDQLAHLTAWRKVAAAELDAVRTGGSGPVVSDDDDVANAEIYERTRHQPAASIRDAAKSSWDQLEAAVEGCSDEDLAKPRIRRPAFHELMWQLIPNHAYIHLAEHLVYWHHDRGDEAAAEEAAKWGYERASSTFPDDRERGVAAYNLGCFYAVRGRANEAMQLLREGIELRPDLRDWAKQDTDLDPIRSTPELANLLG